MRLRKGSKEQEEPILTPDERLAQYLRKDIGEKACFVPLGQSSAAINMNLTREAREELLEDLTPVLLKMGFKDTAPDQASLPEEG